MRKLGRKLKVVILWVLAALLSLGVLAFAFSIMSYFILLYRPVQDRIIRFAESVMNEYLVGEFNIERFESNLLSYIDIYGFHAMGKSEHRDSVYAGHISVRFRPTAILRGRVHINSVSVSDVRGHVVMQPDNDIRLPLIPMKNVDSLYRFVPNPPYREGGRRTRSYDIPKPSNWPVSFYIGPARVDGINAVYRDFDNNMVGEIRNASATARFYTLDSFYVQLRVPDAHYESEWWSGAIDTIGADGVVTWTGLDVHHMTLRGSGTHVTGGGRLSYFEDGPWDLKANFTTAVDPLPALHTSYVEGLGKTGAFSGTASYGGKLYEPLWDATVNGSSLKFRGYNIRRLEVGASFRHDDEYGRARLRGSCEFGEFDIEASLLMKNLMEEPEFGDYAVSALLSGLHVKRIADELNAALPLPIDDASARLRVTGEGFEKMPSVINLSAEFGGADIEGGHLSAGADINGNNWGFAGRWGANRFNGKGKVDLLKGNLRGTVNAELSDPSLISLTLLNERVAGSVNAAAEIEGRVDALNVSASVKGGPVAWRGMRADSLDAQFTVADGVFRLADAGAKLSGHADSVAAYFGQDSVAGYLEADVTMSGGIEDPVIGARIGGRDWRYGQYGIDEARGELSLAGGTVRWRDLRLRSKTTAVNNNGKLALGENLELAANADMFIEHPGRAARPAGRLAVSGSVRGDSLHGKCRLTSAPLEILDPWLPEKHRLKGTLALRGDFAGTPSNPRARVNFQAADPQYYGNRAFTLVGDAVLADSAVNAAALIRLTQRSGAIEFMASLPLSPAAGWRLDETGTRRAQVAANAKDFDIRSVTGFLEPDIWLYGLASFDASMNNAGSGWTVAGSLTLPEGHVRYVPEKTDAHNVSLGVSLSGTLDDPNVAYRITMGQVEMPHLRMDKSFIAGRSVRDSLIIDSSRFSFKENSHAALSGAALYSGMDSIMHNRNFFAQYYVRNIPVTLFSFALPDYNMRKGVFNGSGVIYGENGRPMADGALYLSRLELTVPDVTPYIGPISANVIFKGDTAELASAEAKWGRGTIRAGGRLLWDTDTVYGVNLNVSAADIAFELPEVISVGIEDANLQITDRSGGFNVRGKMALGPTSFIRDFNILNIIEQMQTGGGIRRAPDPFLQSVRLRVDLDLANNANINVNLGNIYMDGRLVIAGNLAEPGIVGEVTVTDGYVYYLDRKFKITEGTLFNPDRTLINPTLNITAKSDVATYTPNERSEMYTVTLSLTGTLENPVVRLSADPALSELDIISVLTFGEKMSGLGSDFNNRMMRLGMNVAAQQVLGLGARRLERQFGLDRVSVSGDIMGAGGSQGAGATVGVSKRLTSRLNLTYENNTSDLGDRKVTAQYRLRPNLYLEGKSGSESENALDLIFRYSR